MQRFVVHRYLDPNDRTSKSKVAEGIAFSDGACAIRWIKGDPATFMFASVEAANIDGEVIFVDPAPPVEYLVE